jgi:hypothetical protein
MSSWVSDLENLVKLSTEPVLPPLSSVDFFQKTSKFSVISEALFELKNLQTINFTKNFTDFEQDGILLDLRKKENEIIEK